MNSADLLISVIVPTCNRPADLRSCLDRLAPDVQAMGPLKYELIVTDDGRKHSAENLISDQYPWVRWTAGPAVGPAANRNHGASIARGRWLIFIDDDCLPEPKLLAAYEREIVQVPDDVPTVLEGPTLRTSVPPSLLWEAPHNPDGGECISANFAISRFDFEASGKFDERYTRAAMEDTEFFARFHFSGGVTKLVPDAIVKHPLRHLSGPLSLANKWEGKAVFSFDQGATAFMVSWRLPWHVLRVIQSRFRNQPWTRDNVRAAILFSAEWILVLLKTPGWVRKWSKQPRSKFWTSHVAGNGPPPRYGF